jgi:hypothetical protein
MNSEPKRSSRALSSGLIWNRSMYSTNAAMSAMERALDRKAPHPARISRNPRYIGLRVTRYTPEITNDEEDSVSRDSSWSLRA